MVSIEQPGNLDNVHIMEVVSEPPKSLDITFLHPTTKNLMCLEIVFELNGSLKATLETCKLVALVVPYS
jgi:hypothetical protein